jgi:hypothetical protein
MGDSNCQNIRGVRIYYYYYYVRTMYYVLLCTMHYTYEYNIIKPPQLHSGLCGALFYALWSVVVAQLIRVVVIIRLLDARAPQPPSFRLSGTLHRVLSDIGHNSLSPAVRETIDHSDPPDHCGQCPALTTDIK